MNKTKKGKRKLNTIDLWTMRRPVTLLQQKDVKIPDKTETLSARVKSEED